MCWLDQALVPLVWPLAWRHAGDTAQYDHSRRIGIYVPRSSLFELCVCVFVLLIVSLSESLQPSHSTNPGFGDRLSLPWSMVYLRVCVSTTMNLPHLSEQHGSNLATIKSASENARIGKDGCFSDAPWNDWKCSWMGLTDQRDESTQEWASGAAFSSSAAFWGEYEPMATAGNAQDCGAVCHGGNLAGYTGDFWVDLECKSEYAFCCDEATFVKDAGTASKDSFLNELAAAKAAKPVAPVPVDPDPYVGRRLCFSTKQTWADAQVGRERRRVMHTRVRCVRCVLCAMCDVCGVLCAVCYVLYTIC